MIVALATCDRLPGWEVDDRFLHDALRARGVAFERPVWDDPSVDWRRFDAVLVRTTWDYQEKLDRFLAWTEAVADSTRLFNPAPVLRWNAHKGYLRDLAHAGVPQPATVWLSRGTRADVGALLQANGFSTGFLKPCVGATARETLRFAADAEGLAAAQAHADRLLPREDLILQPYLRTVEERGEWSAIAIDGAIAHCVRKVPVPGDYRVQDDFGARDEPYAPSPSERALAEHAFAAAAAVPAVAAAQRGAPLLYARADFLWRDDGGCVLTELEAIEPSLFFRHDPASAERLAAALLARVTGPAARAAPR